LVKFDHELERIADFHEQAALNPDTGLADIQNLARRRECSSLQTSGPAYLDPRSFPLESHWLRPPGFDIIRKRRTMPKEIAK
jgi:hypothetical protein